MRPSRPVPWGRLQRVPEGGGTSCCTTPTKQIGETGDLVWGCPSGCREAGEDIGMCAARELWEETGIRADPTPVVTQDIGWALFRLQVP